MMTYPVTSEVADSQTVELLSQIAGKKLDARDATMPVLFLTALIAVLLGVMCVDRQVTEEEKQRFRETLKRFIPPEGEVRQLSQLLVKGIRERKTYGKIEELLVLTAPFSPSEKLLLIGFGYEMSAADGSMDDRERKYLQLLAKHLNVPSEHVAVLEAGLTSQPITDPSKLEAVRFLLDPGRFHELDVLFTSAASDLLDMLPAPTKEPEAQIVQTATTYTQLAKFQETRKALDNLCYKLYQALQECCELEFLPSTMVDAVGAVSRTLQSQRFRVAVLGEFSQGKSTLLNALVGEKIQPVRAIPCSGAIAVLRHGSTKRVICHYQDGRQEEISLEEYKQKATIPKDVAKGTSEQTLDDTLLQTEIKELVFEHPDLELCRNGVDIVDSPGLNEHPNRTAVTNQLIEGTDAAIFLANASRPLTQSERELILDLQARLNNGDVEQPIRNLFVAVNFIDLLDEEDDDEDNKAREDVKERFENFLLGSQTTKQSARITGDNRIHYLSAKAALDAMQKKEDNEYLQSFQQFTQAIENFLTNERGYIKIQHATHQLQDITKKSLQKLKQAEQDLQQEIHFSESQRQEILEQIGEASGREIRIRQFATQLIDEVIEQVNEAFGRWYPPTPSQEEKIDFDAEEDLSDVWQIGLRSRILVRSQNWESQHSRMWSRKNLVKDYANQFAASVQQEIDLWGNQIVRDTLLKPALECLDAKIREELLALKESSHNLSEEISDRFSNQLSLIIDDDITVGGGFMDGAAGVALAIGLGIGGIAAVVPTVIGALIGGAILKLNDGGVHDDVKMGIIRKGFTKFDDSLDSVYESLNELIESTFTNKLEASSKVIREIIDCYEIDLKRNEKDSEVVSDLVEMQEALIAKKRQEIQQIQQEVEAIVEQVAK